MKKKKSNKKEAPKNSQERLMQLNATLDYIEKELEENTEYIEKELPKKWYSEDKIRKTEEKESKGRSIEEPEEAVSKENLRKLQQASSYFEKELNSNEDYIKKEIPKKMELKFSELNELNEERKKILAEIDATRKLLKSLEIERIRLKKEDLKKESQGQIIQLQKYEKFVGKKLSKNMHLYKVKKGKKRSMKIIKKTPIIKPKQAVSEQELVKLQTHLDKLNQELESIKK